MKQMVAEKMENNESPSIENRGDVEQSSERSMGSGKTFFLKTMFE